MCDIGNKNSESSGLYANWMGKEELVYSDWHYIFNKLNPDLIRLDGVEPLLYDKLDLLLDGIPDKPTLMLTTNGWHIEKWFDCLIKNCDMIATSIDGLEVCHDKIRGIPGAFERAFDGALKLKDNGMAVRVSYAINPHNINDMYPLYKKLSDVNIPMVFNHYNIIYTESCKNIPTGINCIRPSNIYYADYLKNIDIDLLYEQIKKCYRAIFLPDLTTKEEIRKYYCEIPYSRKNCQTCIVLKQVIDKQRFTVSSDGSFIVSHRCWIDMDFGNALRHKEYQNIGILQNILDDIQTNGLYPACQRLCCAGKVL